MTTPTHDPAVRQEGFIRHVRRVACKIARLHEYFTADTLSAHIPKPPEGTPAAHFQAAFFPTGYVIFVKMFEFIGGLLVLIPRLRNIGLLLLGPVIVNIIAFHSMVEDPAHLANPMLIIIVICALYLLWDSRKKFAGLLN